MHIGLLMRERRMDLLMKGIWKSSLDQGRERITMVYLIFELLRYPIIGLLYLVFQSKGVANRSSHQLCPL